MDEALVEYMVLLMTEKDLVSGELFFSECNLWVSEYEYTELTQLLYMQIDQLSKIVSQICHKNFPIDFYIDYLDVEMQEHYSTVKASLFSDKTFIINSKLLSNIITDLLFGNEIVADREFSKELFSGLEKLEDCTELDLSRIDKDKFRCLAVPDLGKKYAVVVDRRFTNHS